MRPPTAAAKRVAGVPLGNLHLAGKNSALPCSLAPCAPPAEALQLLRLPMHAPACHPSLPWPAKVLALLSLALGGLLCFRPPLPPVPIAYALSCAGIRMLPVQDGGAVQVWFLQSSRFGQAYVFAFCMLYSLGHARPFGMLHLTPLARSAHAHSSQRKHPPEHSLPCRLEGVTTSHCRLHIR